uniref:Receptor activity-modifying protein 3 n=2 Tax=Latimeria chalumnae TaxID=7897 RepID=H2ZYL4_LATCH|nr:PREDICTED: receptor activity-modifying protein 3-like [Latimeria chalumnae]|eukprot:XP_006012543.1 PREDICTED: receptor activity-modifying protein 3-like [Latimeria chalumnae]
MLDSVRDMCGSTFRKSMMLIDPRNWCNMTYILWYYHNFSNCTELVNTFLGCFWPNPLVETYIISIHKEFFLNCTSDKIIWEDPPDDILITLILVPVLLTLAMIVLVVWCSKRNDLLF